MPRCLVPVSALLLLSATPVAAQTVDDVIAGNIKARGGLEKISALHTTRTTGKLIFFSSFGTFRAGFVQENKRPEMVRQEVIVQGMAQTQAYDGKAAWQISPFGGRKDPELMSQDDAKSLVLDADIEGPLVKYKEKGHKAELVGHDSVEGTDCYKIKLTLKNGDVRYSFLDTDSFMELKTELQSNIRGAIRYTETLYGDYEQVDGLYYPFAIESAEKGSESRQKIAIDKIELNVPLDDAQFSMPGGKPEAKASSAAK